MHVLNLEVLVFSNLDFDFEMGNTPGFLSAFRTPNWSQPVLFVGGGRSKLGSDGRKSWVTRSNPNCGANLFRF